MHDPPRIGAPDVLVYRNRACLLRANRQFDDIRKHAGEGGVYGKDMALSFWEDLIFLVRERQ